MTELTPRTFTILSVLNDLKDAFITLLEKPNKHPALLLMYAFIDICAALANDNSKRTNQEIFTAYLEAFATPGTLRAIPSIQLWAARSAVLHSFSPLGDHTKRGRAKPIFYYAYNEKKADVEASLRARGYSDFTLLSINDIMAIAIWTFNGMISKTQSDSTFRDLVVTNAEHLLLTADAIRVERFLQDVVGRSNPIERSDDQRS